jgi:hypothetical protein
MVPGDRGTVFLVDSIDHFRGRMDLFHQVRESVDRVFSELAEDLRLPGMHVIYTVPVYVKSPIATRNDVLNIKVTTPDDQPHQAGLAALRAVLTRRAPGGDLERLTAGQSDRLLISSGGLFRDLLRLTGHLLLTTSGLPASGEAFDSAEQVVRNDYEMTLSREQLDLLRDIRMTHRLTPANDQWADAIDLMTSGAILRYPNAKQAWYGVHPLLVPLLS